MRTSIEAYYIGMLDLVASRGTCPRRQVAAIITDRHNHILSTGYNGVPSGYPHCGTRAQVEARRQGEEYLESCPGVDGLSGNSDNCMAIHAEQNALLQCRDLSRADVIYCSALPCFTCAKLIANTPIRNIIYRDPYPDTRGAELLSKLGRHVILYGYVGKDKA